MTTESLPDFSNKVVLFYLSDSTSASGVILEYASFQCFAGRVFVVGRSPEMRLQEWISRLQAAVAWDQVTHYFVFDSREDCELRLSKQWPASWVSRIWTRLFG